MGKVVITGSGVVSPLGSNVKEFIQNLEAGYKGISEIKNFDTDYFPSKFGAEAKHDKEVLLFNKDTDRKAEFINDAIAQLLDEFDLFDVKANDIALHLGAGIDYFDLVSYVNSQRYVNKEWQQHCQRSSNVVRNIATKYDIKGGYSTNVSACVASTQAIGLAFRIVKNNPQMHVISGGFDSMLCHLHYLGFYKLGALSNWECEAGDACRPFDAKRSGLVIGEGGVAYMLQDSSLADKSKILAEIVGYASSMDSYMVTDPHPEGEFLAKAALKAISEAGITPDQIDCVHAHGTGTFRNGLSEAKAIHRIFGKRGSELPVFSLKGQIGHLIGACGAMELLGVIDSFKNQRVLPTVNFEYPDKNVPLNVIRGEALHTEIKYILKLNAAFGGQNTALVLKNYD